MIKNNKGKLVITSIVILLPIVAGLILWNYLPEEIATHWNFEGEANGWSNRGFAVFGLPLFLLAVHWICLWASSKDPKNKDQNHKLQTIVLWICPGVSILCAVFIYATALGIELNMDFIGLMILGFMFIIIGNYMPKCKQNYTLGIKLPWTVRNEENWNKTHRLAGKVWVIGGIVMIACVFLPKFLIPIVMVGMIFLLVMIPTVYSYVYHKNRRE